MKISVMPGYTQTRFLLNSDPGRVYIGIIKAEDLFEAGITISPRPLDNNKGHAELSDITYQTRRDSQALDKMAQLAAMTKVVDPAKIPKY